MFKLFLVDANGMQMKMVHRSVKQTIGIGRQSPCAIKENLKWWTGGDFKFTSVISLCSCVQRFLRSASSTIKEQLCLDELNGQSVCRHSEGDNGDGQADSKRKAEPSHIHINPLPLATEAISSALYGPRWTRLIDLLSLLTLEGPAAGDRVYSPYN